MIILLCNSWSTDSTQEATRYFLPNSRWLKSHFCHLMNRISCDIVCRVNLDWSSIAFILQLNGINEILLALDWFYPSSSNSSSLSLIPLCFSSVSWQWATGLRPLLGPDYSVDCGASTCDGGWFSPLPLRAKDGLAPLSLLEYQCRLVFSFFPCLILTTPMSERYARCLGTQLNLPGN